MGIVDFLGKIEKAASINWNKSEVLSFYNRVNKMLEKTDYIPDTPYKIAEQAKKMEEYERTYRTGYYKADLDTYNEYVRLRNNHNETVRKIKTAAVEFKKIYDSAISNPENFNSNILNQYREFIRIIEDEFNELTEDIALFVTQFNELSKDLPKIKLQHKNLPLANEMLNFKGDYYLDECNAKYLFDKFLVLLPKQGEKHFYKFPTTNQLEEKVSAHNTTFINNHINDKIFDDINGISLDKDQRRAILCDENMNLVVAGAGSGKTLTICGKVKYLIDIFGVAPEEILLLSFSRASADDLAKKAKKIAPKVEAKTFHSMGLEILKKSNNCSFAIEEQFGKIIEDFFEEELIHRQDLLTKVVNYYGLYSSSLGEKTIYESQSELYDALAKKDYWTLKEKLKKIGDGDKKTTLKQENVKSYEELVIANFYYLNGVDYEYEKPYEHKTDSAEYRQYRPDFYLPKYNLYHEHFAINKDGNAIQFGVEESKKYLDGMTWKRQKHAEYQTKCIETYSYQFSNGDFFTSFQNVLRSNGVQLKPIPMEEVWCKLKGILNKSDFSSFRVLITTFVSLYKSRYKDERAFEELKRQTFENDYERQRASHLLDICKEVYLYYKKRLHYVTYEDKQPVEMIDFDDMILKSVDCLPNLKDMFKYKYIIVDEFQDISYSRMMFLKALMAHGKSKLFAVGDDWQSIYRFSGCDIDIFINSQNYFGKTTVNFINSTHRNSMELIDIAAPFITANSEQFKKNVKSSKHIDSPIRIVCYDNDKVGAFIGALEKIKNDKPDASVLVLGRNNFDLEAVMPSKGAYKQNDELVFDMFDTMKITYKTVHSSKGLEADYVILINADDDKLGFPNKIEDDKLLRLVLSNKSEYPYAEERRLFYVAITRTKNVCYILVDKNKPSEFVKEIKTKCKFIKYYTAPDKVTDTILCPICKGKLVIRMNEKNKRKFYGCSHYPLCRYTNNDLQMVKDNKRCPKCGDFITLRKSRNGGQFWGCHSYPSCNFIADATPNYRKYYH